MPNKNTFHLAITMAGAISAGAYTAGVMDYLIEVLDKWETMKADDSLRDQVPRHKVVIDVLSGASAGGMTACIASLAIQRELHPITTYNPVQKENYDHLTNAQFKQRKNDNRLYNSWINLTADDMIPQLLETDDIGVVSNLPEKTFISALNSNFIRRIAKDTLVLRNPEPLAFPPFVSKNLRTFVTLTNLDGFKKEIPFAAGGSSSFFTYDHRDVAMFSFDHKDSIPYDGSIDVDFLTGANTEIFINAGMGTGAFPIGLAYRTFSRNRKYIEKNILLRELNGGNSVVLDAKDIFEMGQYIGTFIDGGTIDNEPFKLTQFLLENQVKANGETFDSESFSTFNSTVLMIDPFPSEERVRISYQVNQSPISLLGAISKLFSTVRTQSMLKTEDINKAINRNSCSRFLVSPRRKIPGQDPIDGSLAIACGSLGGFGGFLDKDFRKHDFYLGRINCKSFIQRHFVISDADAQSNPVFSQSYADIPQNQQIRDTFRNEVLDSQGNVTSTTFPIIPDVNLIIEKGNQHQIDINDLYFNLDFPTITEEKFRLRFMKYKKGIRTRLRTIVQSNLEDKSMFSWYASAGLLFGGRTVFDKIYEYVKDELKRWQIIK